MRRSIALLVPLLVLACGGGGGGTDRRTLVDSRDIYDPRSLDPALSTDVPTGRAVGYLFDGLTRFTPDAPRHSRRWPRAGKRLARRADLHLPPAARRHLHRRHALRRAPGALELAAGARPEGARRPRLASLPDPRREGIRRRQGDDRSRDSPPRTTPPSSCTLKEPFAIFPKLLAMPVASIAPEHVPENFGEHPVGTGPWRLVEWKHDDYLLFAPNENYWGGPPQGRLAQGAHHRRAEHGRRRVPERQRGRPADSAGRDRRLGGGRRAPEAARLHSVARARLRRHQHDARTLSRTCASGRRSTTPSTGQRIVRNLIAGRGELAAGVIPPSLPGADNDTHRLPVRHYCKRDSSSARPAIRTASISSSGPRRIRSTSASPRRCRPTSGCRASA